MRLRTPPPAGMFFPHIDVRNFMQQRRQKRVGIEIFVHRDAVSRIGGPRRPMVAQLGESGPTDPHRHIPRVQQVSHVCVGRGRQILLKQDRG